jgi:alpha-1,6-mannosyltransferase
VTADDTSSFALSGRPEPTAEGLTATLRRRFPSLFTARSLAPEPPFEGWGFLWRPALLGLLALVAIAVGSSFSNSPFKPELPDAWFFGVPTTTVPPFATTNSTTLLFGITLVYGGLVLLMRVWLRLVEVVRRHPGAPVGRLGWMLALWILPMLVIAPIFSRDVYSYAAQGEMMTRHINPYRYGPWTLGSGPYPDLVDKLWHNVPSAYGPLFLWMDGGIVQLTGHNELWTIVGLRLLEVVAVAILAVALPALARALKLDAGNAFVLCLLNPLVVLTLVGGAHNDALMVAFLVAGLALAVKKHPVLGILLCAVAASIKAPAALGVVYIAWEWLGPKLPVRMRLRPLAIGALLLASVLGAFTWLSGLGFGWIGNLETPGTVVSWMSPATGLGMGLAQLVHLFGFNVATSSAISVTRTVGLLASFAIIGWLLLNADRIGWLKALGYSLVALVVLGPVVQPWYLTWGLLLLAPVVAGRVRTAVLALSVVSPFLGLPGGRLLLLGIVHAPMVETGLVLFLLWALLGAPLGKWANYGRRAYAPAAPPPLAPSRQALPEAA